MLHPNSKWVFKCLKVMVCLSLLLPDFFGVDGGWFCSGYSYGFCPDSLHNFIWPFGRQLSSKSRALLLAKLSESCSHLAECTDFLGKRTCSLHTKNIHITWQMVVCLLPDCPIISWDTSAERPPDARFRHPNPPPRRHNGAQGPQVEPAGL